jgi:ParB family chromosome partitioning protein
MKTSRIISIPVAKVRITDRIRNYPGDLTELASSMEGIGLLNPIVIDSNNYLIAGYRRLTAARKLGWQEIEARVVDVRDKKTLLMIEMEENTTRRDFTPEQLEHVQRLLARQEKTGVVWKMVNWLLG